MSATTSRLLVSFLLLAATGVAVAQDEPNPFAVPSQDSTQVDNPEDNPFVLPQKKDDNNNNNANPLNRPLARALAYERRDFVEDLLLRPSQLSTDDAAKLAKDLSIPEPHAQLAIEAAKAKVDVSDLNVMLQRGLPEGFKVAEGTDLLNVTSERLVELGMSQQQSREFLRWRRSARRITIHSREVQALRELKIKGEASAAETARRIMRGSGVQKVQAIAQALGLFAPEATEARAERQIAEQRANSTAQAMKPMRPDPFVQYRRGDGTLDWKKLGKSESMGAAGGMIHFAFSLFLKELTVVLRTGDKSRLSEFMDGLMSTDFYVNYGLFAVGARTADAMYGQYVRRISKKRFMNGVMRSNLVLAAGLALPMVVRGQFSLDTYVVDVAALGLSATLVKGAIEGSKGVYRLVRGGKGAINLGKLATPAGWVFTAAETAVVLLIGDYVANKVDKYLDQRQLRKAIKASQGDLGRLLQAVDGGQDVSEAEIRAAVMAVETAYDALRENQTAPLKGRLAGFQKNMDEVARLALRGEAQAEAMDKALKANPALRTYFANRYGSTDAYLQHLRQNTNQKAETKLEQASTSFEDEWDALLKDTYEGDTTAADPLPTQGSRLATYDDQTEALLKVLDSTKDPAARDAIALAIARVRQARKIDEAIFKSGEGGQAPAPAPAQGSGMSQALPGQDKP